MKYLLEPMLFAIDDSCTKEAFQEYIDNLLEWQEWQKKHEIDIYMLSSTEDCLYGTGNYPVAKTIKGLIKKHDIKGVNYDLVDKVIRKLIQKSVKIDKELSYEIMLSNLSIEPSEEIASRSQSMIEELKKLLWYEYYQIYKCKLDADEISLFVKGIQGEITYSIEYLEDDRKTIKTKCDEITSYCNTSPKNYLLDEMTPYRIWKQAHNKDEIDEGIRVAVYRDRGYENLQDAYDNIQMVIQDSFYQEFCDNSYATKDSELKSAILACMYAVTNQNLALMHDIRKSKCGGSPQFKVNGYGAWRRNSTTSIKIAYWKKKERFLLADIGEHDFIEPTQELHLMT